MRALIACPVGVPANPPIPVSRNDAGKPRPTLSIAIIHSSVGILLVQPANAISAAIKALPAPIAFRLTHGISTKPAVGSHTSPRRLEIVIDIACALCSGVPLAASTAAAAPIAEALPTSAWQPPWHQQYPHG